MKIRVSDYIAQTLAKHGIRHVFMVTGGGAMHLNDAFGRCKELEVICCHHEQACSMAGESYYRMTNRLAAINVTSGPGGTNAITGVYGAWVDSLGMIVISGQVKYETVVRSTGLPLRQLGDQELDITPMVKPVTKYAEMVIDAKTIRYHLEKALYLATSGRPGPVWLDVPLDVQGALIEPSELKGYDPSEDQAPLPSKDVSAVCRQIRDRLATAKRPVIFAGSGIRLSGAYDDFLKLLEMWKIPVVTAWNAHDLVWDEHPCYAGRPGTVGDRPGNFAVQNSDFLLVLGCRLNIRQISYNWKAFARHAYKVIVDIDATELKKPTLSPDLPVHADVADLMRGLIGLGAYPATQEQRDWLSWCKERVRKYPVVQAEYWDTKDCVNPYCFMDALFKQLPEGQKVVTGDGTACVASFQAAHLRKGQRLYTNSGCASMGYDLPAAIGACIAEGRKDLICLAGDGSIQMNLQELQTIVGQKLPIKIFVLNNGGYHSIRQTQNNYFPDSPVGFDEKSGVSFPDMEKLAYAYGIPYRKCRTPGELKESIASTLRGSGPQICEILLDLNQPFAPKLASRKLPDGRMVSAPLEDMFPFLSREEFKSNMIVPTLEE